jgi:hypothetical protein
MIKQDVNQFTTTFLVSIQLLKYAHHNAHRFIGKTYIFWHVSENKKACKYLIYRLLVVFNFAINGVVCSLLELITKFWALLLYKVYYYYICCAGKLLQNLY